MDGAFVAKWDQEPRNQWEVDPPEFCKGRFKLVTEKNRQGPGAEAVLQHIGDHMIVLGCKEWVSPPANEVKDALSLPFATSVTPKTTSGTSESSTIKENDFLLIGDFGVKKGIIEGKTASLSR